MQAFVFPFLYCLLLGSAWAVFFRRKFFDSLAPALMLHMILVMLSGMAFHRLSIGLYGGMALFAAVLAWRLVKERPDMKALAHSLWNGGVFVFLVLYLFCFFFNSGKHFTWWDEFGHWGVFLKESLRMDMLYAESPLPLSHRDYVPATTLFEVIWCRLSGRFLEADAYRAIQMVMFAMMLPMFGSFAPQACGGTPASLRQSLRGAFSGRGRQLAAVFFVMMLLLLFRSGQAKFYNSIVVDYFLGVVFFYCVMVAWRDEENRIYQALVLSLGFATLLLTKLNGVMLLPLAFALHVEKLSLFDVQRGAWRGSKLLGTACVPVAVSVLLLYSFTAFVDTYALAACDPDPSTNTTCSATGSIQSYSGFRGEAAA